MDEQKRLNLVIVMLIALLIMLGSVVYYVATGRGDQALESLGIVEEVEPKAQVADTEMIEYPESMSESQRAEFVLRVANPVFDYYSIEKHGQIVAFGVALSETGQATSPYVTMVGFEDGTQEEFEVQLINEQIQWWIPNCTQCGFSEEFKAKYPELVAFVEN